jgi:hypothetical protein
MPEIPSDNELQHNNNATYPIAAYYHISVSSCYWSFRIHHRESSASSHRQEITAKSKTANIPGKRVSFTGKMERAESGTHKADALSLQREGMGPFLTKIQ